MKVTTFLVLVAVLALTVVGTVRYGATGVASASPVAAVALAPQADSDLAAQVYMSAMTYHPRELHVALGTEVTWTNRDHAKYTVTGDDFDSGILGYHDVFSHTFYEPGKYYYHCRTYKWMTGVVIVE